MVGFGPWLMEPPLGGGWKHKLQILVYRIEKFLSKLCTVIFAQYLVFSSLSRKILEQ